jgi:hypothetical protein
VPFSKMDQSKKPFDIAMDGISIFVQKIKYVLLLFGISESVYIDQRSINQSPSNNFLR